MNKIANTTQRSNYILLIFESVLFFFYFYKANLAFLGIPSALHTTRLVSLVYFAIFLFGGKNIIDKKTYAAKCFKRTLIFLLFVLLYCYLIIFSIGKGDGRNVTDDIINQILFGFLMLFPLTSYFKNLDRLMSILLIVHIIQSIVVWACVINPSISLLLDLTVNASESSDWFIEQRESYAGGIGCITSSGAIKFSFGLVACLYKYYIRPSVKYLILFAFFSVTISMIARTGLILALITLLFLLLGSNKQRSYVKAVVAIVVLLVVFFAFSNIDKSSDFYYDHFRRFERFEEKKGVLTWVTDAYLAGETTIIPPLSYETMRGTTVTSGVSGDGIRVNADGGYIRNYVALGLPLAIFFYVFVFGTCFKLSWKSKDEVKKILLLCTVFLIIGEFKEPYLFTIIPWTLFYLIAFLSTSKISEIR